MNTKTITLTQEEINQLEKRLAHGEIKKTPNYAKFQIKVENCTITAYNSGKVVFQGEDASNIAKLVAPCQKDTASVKIKSSSSSSSSCALAYGYPQCGSDEVGTGDYFGPVTVCAACVKESDIAFLNDLAIQDSKALQDDYIRKIAPQLIKRLTHSLLILDNRKYNAIHDQYNMVAIKTRLHNQAYVHLLKKLDEPPKICIIDQFVQKTSYYRYLNGVNEVVRNIHFETKAENKYLSVAAASIIARYAFLECMDKMSEHYQFDFLKGAGSKVDQNIRDFVDHYSQEELQNVAKLHFANTKKAFA